MKYMKFRLACYLILNVIVSVCSYMYFIEHFTFGASLLGASIVHYFLFSVVLLVYYTIIHPDAG